MSPKFSNEINKKVKELRKKKGFTQERVAELLGMKTSTYSQMEREGNIPAQRLMNLAAIFEVDPIELMSAGGTNLVVAQQNENIATFKQYEKEEAFSPSESEKTSVKMSRDRYNEDTFIFTNREKNSITMLRNMEKEDSEYIYKLIKELHDKKFGKN